MQLIEQEKKHNHFQTSATKEYQWVSFGHSYMPTTCLNVNGLANQI